MNSSGPSLRQRLYAACGEPGFIQCHAAYWIWKVVPFCLMAFGTVANITSLAVFMRQKLRQRPTTVFFATIAISDLTATWSGLLRNILMWVIPFDITTWTPFHCKITEAFAHIGAGTTNWTLVLLTVERVISVLFPHYARTTITRKHTAISAVSAFVLNLLLNCHFFLWKQLQREAVDINLDNKDNDTASPGTVPLTDVCGPANDVYDLFMTKWWNVIVLVVFNIMPFIIILSGNMTIAARLWRQRNNSLHSQRSSSVTKLLFGLSIFFLLCVTPYCAFKVVFQSLDETVSGQTMAWMQLFFAVAFLFLTSNYTLNFCFYFLTGSIFRMELYSLMSAMKINFRKRQVSNTRSSSAEAS